MSKNLSLKFLPYDKKDGHKELTDSIHELCSLVEAKVEEIKDSKDW